MVLHFEKVALMLCLAVGAGNASLAIGASLDRSSETGEEASILAAAHAVEVETADALPYGVTMEVFKPILADLQRKTQIPVRLPTDIPGSDEPNQVHALLETATPSSYRVMLAYIPDCTGGTACRLGSVAGETATPNDMPLEGEKVVFAGGLAGFFVDAVCRANCSDATLSWEQNGARYSIGLKGGTREQLTSMAESAAKLVFPGPDEEFRRTPDRAVSPRYLISEKGIGDAKVGMTYGRLKAAFGDVVELKEIGLLVHTDAIAVSKSGQVQYYILYPAGKPRRDSDVIDALLTDNLAYTTAEGVGPGTPIEQAEKFYGEAVLFYNTSGESREYLRFAGQPYSNIHFRLAGVEEGFAGVYPDPPQEYNETQTYRDGATIGSIEVRMDRSPD